MTWIEEYTEIKNMTEYMLQTEFDLKTDGIASTANQTIYIDIETPPKTHISIAKIDGRFKYIVGHNRETTHILTEMGHGLGEWYSFDEMTKVIRRLYKKNEQISLFGVA